MKDTATITDDKVAADPLSEYDGGHTDRARGLPMLGWMIGGSVSLLLWSALSLSAWALLMR